MKTTKKKTDEPRSIYTGDLIEHIERKDPADRTDSQRRLLKRVKQARERYGKTTGA